jgi:hypothetical protein
MRFPKFWALGRAGAFHSWRWSDTSVEEAYQLATAAAARMAASFAQEGRPLASYDYGERPLREPVLEELRNEAGELSAVITRNSYGCQVMNAARAMFVDVDLPEKPASAGGLLRALFGARPVEPAQAAIEKAENWARLQSSSWNWRIYRTPAGLRLLASHALFDPADPVCQSAFDAVGADPLYRKLCHDQQCFRARLTPKPWRCEMDNPPSRWPFEGRSAEVAFANWESAYLTASRNKASCKLISEGNGRIHEELRPLVRLHDEMTRAKSSLPLA